MCLEALLVRGAACFFVYPLPLAFLTLLRELELGRM
jgi:hypothetical protein